MVTERQYSLFIEELAGKWWFIELIWTAILSPLARRKIKTKFIYVRCTVVPISVNLHKIYTKVSGR